MCEAREKGMRVSEELSSVETVHLFAFHHKTLVVSEELSSVETDLYYIREIVQDISFRRT